MNRQPAPSPGVLERPRYFPRQLITPDELTLEADYFRDRMRRHNIHLHGWGVVCGALVCVVPADGGGPMPWVVAVQPGYVLGPYGDEIVIDPGCQISLQGNGTGVHDDVDDPWCVEVYTEQPDGPRYVAVRYREHRVRPVRAQPAGCGCDETPCEYSRYRDGYEIGVLDACPGSHHRTGDGGTGTAAGNPVCPAAPDSPWVVLAKVTLDGDGTVTEIDNCACRRIVASARDSWYTCGSTDADHPPATEEQQPDPGPDTDTEPEPAPQPDEQPDAEPVPEPAGDGPADAGSPDAAAPEAPKPRRPARARRRPSAGSSS